jgi:hypothetical protein
MAQGIEQKIDPPHGALTAHADQHRPLTGYAALIVAFNGAIGTALVLASRGGRLPERPRAADVALCGVATYKLSRLIARDRVTSAIRAPFTRFQDDAGHGEVDEAARGRGLRRAVGELLVCPDCLGQWVAGGFAAGLWFAPRETRAVAGMFTMHALADALQLATSAAQQRV